MDPFTQKLLARTQARKDQLIKKREELQACRTKRNSPIQDRTRRPLSEDNTDSSSSENDEFKRRRIGSEDSGKDALLKSAKNIDVNSPSVQARKERLMKMQQKDQENGITPKKHWKPLNHGLADSNTPSVASRSAAFETNCAASHVQQENARNTSALSQMPSTTSKLAEAKSVFENSEKQPCNNTVKEKLCAPPKPPRLADTESKSDGKPVEQQQPPPKRKAPSPPGDKKDGKESSSDSESGGKCSTQVKRKAPEPPVSAKQVDKEIESMAVHGSAEPITSQAVTRCPSTDEEAESSVPVPAKRERKGSVDALDATEKNGNDQPTPKPRRKAQNTEEVTDAIVQKEKHGEPSLKSVEKQERTTEVSVITARPVVNERVSKKETSKKKAQESVPVIQACVVEDWPSEVAKKNVNSEKPVISKAVPCEVTESRSATKSKAKVTQITDAFKHGSKATKVHKQDHDEIVPAVSVEGKHTASSRKKTKEPKQDDFLFKLPEGPARPCQFDPDETINLNDVNIHDITFNFDFGKFDQELEKERESMFKMSYEENCKKLEKEKKREERKRKESDAPGKPPRPSPISSDPEIADNVFHSGYNSKSSEQYATRTTPKTKPDAPQRPKRTQDIIKMLLEEAAYQQNIVLQASRAVNLCVTNDITFRGSQEEVEAERVLLLATEHRTACLDEVQRLKTGSNDGVPEFISHGNGGCEAPCKATLTISDIKIHLRQDFMDVLRVGIRNDLGVFYFVCIMQHGPHEFFCSKVLSTNDVAEGNFLLFTDKFTVKDLNPNFNVAIKIFCMNIKKTVLTATPTTPKHKIFQSPKVVKGMFSGRRGTENPSPAIQIPASPHTVFRTSNFSLVGVTRVSLPVIKSKRFSLDKVPEGCPLHCFIEMKAACSPWYNSYVKGFLTILEDIGGYGAWQRRWCVLDSAVISYWRYPGDEASQPPLGSINLGECISDSVTRVARDLCARPNTMELKLKRTCGTEVKYLLAADTKTDRATWLDSLNEALKNWRAWTTDGNRQLYPELSHLYSSDVYMCSKKSPENN